MTCFGVMTFISTFISNLGNRCQKRLFIIWGGVPTTIILRHADRNLDRYTKQRYHKWLNDKIDNLDLPALEDEEKDPVDADLKYQSAINFLREFTRDKAKFPAVYRDNVVYGFSRNLLAIRKFGLLISFTCMSVNLHMARPVFGYGQTEVDLLISSDYLLGVGAGLASAIFLFAFIFIVNNNFVKERGFRYAKTLLETCEEP